MIALIKTQSCRISGSKQFIKSLCQGHTLLLLQQMFSMALGICLQWPHLHHSGTGAVRGPGLSGINALSWAGAHIFSSSGPMDPHINPLKVYFPHQFILPYQYFTINCSTLLFLFCKCHRRRWKQQNQSNNLPRRIKQQATAFKQLKINPNCQTISFSKSQVNCKSTISIPHEQSSY